MYSKAHIKMPPALTFGVIMITYKLKQISLVPDEYGQHLKIKMVTKYDNGKYAGHVKINQDIVEKLLDGTITYEQ